MTDEQRKKRNAYMREWKKQNKDKVNSLARRYRKKPDRREHDREYQQEWRKSNPQEVSKFNKRKNRKILMETIEAYGGKCYCCGETNPLFMTIDHTNSDGGQERRERTGQNKGGFSGVILYSWLKKNGYPKDRYRLSCFNCNAGRVRNDGVCPHELQKKEVA